MSKASSASKVAKMAEKGRGRKVRFQGGTLFPAVVALVFVLGTLLIVYSRSASYANADGPRASDSDHYHLAYSFFGCDAALPTLVGNKEEVPVYATYGVHSHEDGVIHYHPSTGASSGRNAKLKRFLEVYDVELTDTKLTFPADQGGAVYEEGVTKCKDASGKEVDGQLRVAVWDVATDESTKRVITANLSDARITRNGMAFTIGFVPEGTELPAPPTAANLEELGAIDTQGGSAPTTAAAVTDSSIAGASDSSAPAAAGTDAPTTDAASSTDAPTTDSATTDAPTTSGG